VFDINPEGIGVQPMIAKITLGFDFIGGHGLANPIKQLQNALSFNYYANTEIYDERAVATEDTSERDNELVQKIVKGAGANTGAVSTRQVENQLPQKGGGTIGTIVTTNSQNNGSFETGEIEYTPLINELSTGTQNYFKTIVDQTKTIVNLTNSGILSLVSLDRSFSEGQLDVYGTPVGAELYGKSNSIEERVEKLVDKAVDDVATGNNPITLEYTTFKILYDATDASLRNLSRKLEEEISKMKTELNDLVIVPLNTMTTYQETYNYTLRKSDVVCNSLDGIKLGTGNYKVYTLTADTNGTITKITTAFKTTVGDKITDFSKKFLKDNVITGNYNTSTLNFDPVLTIFPTEELRRFYLVMSPIFLDDNKFNTFVDSLTGVDKVKDKQSLVDAIRRYCETLKRSFKTEHDAEIKQLEDATKSEDYITNYEKFTIEQFDSKIQYTTDNVGDNIQKKKKLADLYSDVNVNNKQNTFNGKVKFS
jgi:hypothetical protein